MVLRDKIIFWLLALFAFSWFIGSVSAILFPFISAIIIAYFLDPLADKLERFKLSRPLSALVILSIFIAAISVIGILVIPALYKEFLSLVGAIPRYSNIFLSETYPKITAFLQENGYEVDSNFRQYLREENVAKIFNFSNGVVGSFMQSSITVINILSLVFITPILVFYLLKDWNLLVDNVDKYLPSKYAFKIRKIFLKIDITLSGYVRGQFNVCLILGVMYAIGLTIIGLNFGFLIGFLTGIMAFVPYVGMLIGVGIAIIISLFQWGLDFGQIGLLGGVFIAGQMIESNFLTPKLVGKKIGLHPVWVIFAIFAFGVLFGFVGVLLAVPMAAILGVITRFAFGEYRRAYVNKKVSKS
jgi:predicted PurR-regulated permease PerM